ncbi:MAG: TetR family transcriptional regulator [Jatrophihabitantaceae bacterium]
MTADPSRPGSARGRGRPRAEQDNGDTRQRLLAAARSRFATDGFDRASLRSIAADAGVDASLIRHYFGDKNGLLVATMQLPVDPVALLRDIVADGPDGLGNRLALGFLQTWDAHHEVFAGLLRTTLASAEAAPPALDVLRSIVLSSLTGVLSGPDAPLRANLVMAQIIGMAMLRYVLRIEPLAASPSELVAARYGPLLQALITPG